MSIFDHLDRNQLDRAEEVLPKVTLKTRELLLSAGARDGAAALVTKGIFDWEMPDGERITRGGVGHLVGVGQLVWPQHPMPHAIRAVGALEAIVFTPELLDQLAAEGIDLREAVERFALLQMTEASRALDTWIAELLDDQANAWNAPSRSLFSEILEMFGLDPQPSSRQDGVDALRACPPFADGADRVLATIAAAGRFLSWDTGEELTRQFSVADSMHLVVSGEVLVGATSRPEVEPRELERLGRGGIVGVGGVLGEIHLSSSVALAQTTTWSISRGAMTELMARPGEVGRVTRVGLLRVAWDILCSAQARVRQLLLNEEAIAGYRNGTLSEYKALAILGTYSGALDLDR